MFYKKEAVNIWTVHLLDKRKKGINFCNKVKRIEYDINELNKLKLAKNVNAKGYIINNWVE